MIYKLFFSILQLFLKKTNFFSTQKMMCRVFAVSFSESDVSGYLYFYLHFV